MHRKRSTRHALGLLALFVFTLTFAAVVTVEADDPVCGCCTAYCPDGETVKVYGHWAPIPGGGRYCNGSVNDTNCTEQQLAGCYHMTYSCSGTGW